MVFRNCIQFPDAGGSGVIVREYLSTRLEHNNTLPLDNSLVVGHLGNAIPAPAFKFNSNLSYVNLLASPSYQTAAIVCLIQDSSWNAGTGEDRY
jgi:hypothetical protein